MIKKLSIVFIILISFPGLAFAQQSPSASAAPAAKLVPPAHGKIPVAIIIGRGAETIDFVGPWEVFQFAFRPSAGAMSMEDMELFQLYIVSDSKEPVRVTGGMRIIPDYTYADAPEPKVIVVPATTSSPEMLDWIRKMTKRSDVVMSVCLGAYHLAEAGVLSGKQATTNDGAYVNIQRKYPDVHFLRNRRWVQSDPVIFTSGATGAGIDLALHIVELYFGHDVAARAARAMNYKSQDWTGDGTESIKDPLPSDRFSTGVLGNWQGEVMTKEGPLQLAIHIWPYPDDKHLVGTADILNRDVRDLFIDPIALNGTDLHFEIHNGASTFDGKLNAEGTAIEGNWKQSGASAPLVLKRIQPPAKDVGDGTRGTIAPGGTLEFMQLKIAVLATTVDSSAATPHAVASIRLEEGGATEEWTARQGEAFNWHGYHVAIGAVHGPGESGGGWVELAVATVASLPQCIGKPVGKTVPGLAALSNSFSTVQQARVVFRNRRERSQYLGSRQRLAAMLLSRKSS